MTFSTNTTLDERQHRLQNCLSTACERRMQATNINTSPRGDHPEPLLNHCYANAIVLCAVLEERGFDWRLVAGGLEHYLREYDRMGGDTDAIDSVARLSEVWVIHYWVEVDDPVEDVTWVLECASEDRDRCGDAVVWRRSELPDTYVLYDDSQSFGAEAWENAVENTSHCFHCGSLLEEDMMADPLLVCPGCGREWDPEEGFDA